MKYIVDQNTSLKLETTNYVEAGIQENLELKQVEFRRLDTGTEFIAFYFEDELGRKLSHTEYNPGEDEKKVANQIARIKQILCGPLAMKDGKVLNPEAITFIKPEEFLISANNFEEFCNAAIKALGNKHVGKKVRVKCGYYKIDKSGKSFVSLPSYSVYSFIEPMSIPKEKSKLRILSIDKMTRPEPTGNTGTASVFETVANATKPGDDIPF